MARLFVTDINLNKNELQNARIQGLSSAPLNPVTGQIYYNTSENKMYYYNGLAAPDGPWVSMSGSDEVIQDVLNDTIIAGYGITKTYGDPANTLTLEIDTSETADLTTAQTLTNKTIGDTLYFNNGTAAGNISHSGSDLTINASDDLTLNTETGNISLTPDGNANVNGDVIVTEQASQTLTNKTLTSPVVTDLHLNDSAITFEGSTENDYETTLQVTNPSADREITIPDATGTVALVENKLHDFALATQSVDLNNQKIINLAEPVDPQDAATKYYVDSAVAGLTWKRAVHLIATTNVDLTGATNTLVIDGHEALTQAEGDGYRILLAGQTTASEDGIYVYNDNGTTYTLTRSTDADSFSELKGAAVFVMEGSSYGSTSWVQANHYLTNFDNQEWDQFAGASDYTAGAGLVADGNVFNVGQGLGISVTANEVAIDTAVTARKYSATIGNGSATSYVINHGLNNQFVVTQVYQNSSPFALVETDVELTSPTQVTIRFSVAPTADQYIVNIIG
jgi:hypothetical protein